MVQCCLIILIVLLLKMGLERCRGFVTSDVMEDFVGVAFARVNRLRAWDRRHKDELLTHHFGGRHGDVEPSGDDSPLRQGAGCHGFVTSDVMDDFVGVGFARVNRLRAWDRRNKDEHRFTQVRPLNVR